MTAEKIDKKGRGTCLKYCTEKKMNIEATIWLLKKISP